MCRLPTGELPRLQVAAIEPSKRAANLLLRMAEIARKVCVAAGIDHIANADGEQQISRIPRERLARDAIDAIYQKDATFMKIRRTDHAMGVYLTESDVLCGQAEARVAMGSGFPDESVSTPCMQTASLP